MVNETSSDRRCPTSTSGAGWIGAINHSHHLTVMCSRVGGQRPELLQGVFNVRVGTDRPLCSAPEPVQHPGLYATR